MLEAGADAAVIARSMSETQARRAEAEARVRPDRQRQVMTTDQIAARIAQIGDIPATLTGAAEDRAEFYSQLGLTMTYDPARLSGPSDGTQISQAPAARYSGGPQQPRARGCTGGHRVRTD
jgi:hypothetical protein